MDTKDFEILLYKEKQKLELGLSTVSTKDPGKTDDWTATYPDLNVDPSDKSDMADEVEGFDTNLGINTVLEEKLRDVNDALERISTNTYGICSVGKEQIELERLRANPSARTCMKHAQ